MKIVSLVPSIRLTEIIPLAPIIEVNEPVRLSTVQTHPTPPNTLKILIA